MFRSLIGEIPHTVRLTVYTGEAKDLSAELLQTFVDGVQVVKTRSKLIAHLVSMKSLKYIGIWNLIKRAEN